MGRQMLMLWKLTAFEPVPEDYDTICKKIAAIYPSPVAVVEPIAAPKTEEAKPEIAPKAAPAAKEAEKAEEPEAEPTPAEPEATPDDGK
jgi:hypothetical protein